GGDYCAECGLCIDCVETLCYCGNGCSNCAIICSECGEKCENCADDQLCADCERCFDCAGGDYCAECGLCIDCVETLCYCGNGCSNCAVVCAECNEKCENCADGEICVDCGLCIDCAGGDGFFCTVCALCIDCVETLCYCGEGCSNCAVVCPDCGEKCSNCSDGEICIDCGFCIDCVGADNFCSDCALCITCVEMVCSCGGGCTNCAVVCMECCEKCSNCSDGELCMECGKCIDCAGSENFCINCGLCGDCGTVCPCGEGCENCADLCPDCGEKCSNCFDEFCASCDICRECANDMFCEDCYQCADCTEVCEDCGIVCTDCAESLCEDCGKCSGCIDEFCPDCGICIECADAMCADCHYCASCTDICDECGEYCTDCADVCPACEICENCTDICPDCKMCADCCADVSEDFGCTHGICVESDEWDRHFCPEGEHCLSEDAETEYDDTEHWTVCGDGCGIRLNARAHSFGAGTVTKEATQKEEGIMTVSCTECGYEKEETIPKLSGSHTHEYTAVVTKPTCTTGGYTTHTCSCGHSWTDMVLPPLHHAFAYESSADEHWQECALCHEKQASSSHKFSEWNTVVKPGYTFPGEKQRVCKVCGYTLSEAIPILSVPEDKLVITIPNYPVSDPEQSTPNPDGENPSAPSTPDTDTPDTGTPDTPSPTVKELLTKGKDQTVPALPTLPPAEEGNLFDGWVDKATGETVKKGDKLTGNVELVPVFKDCGKDNHSDADEDGRCDECGYILPKDPIPEDTTAPTDTDPTPSETDPTTDEEPSKGSWGWLIALLAALFGTAVIGGGAWIAGKNRKKEKQPTEPQSTETPKKKN
ncbi:MAG: hypothetical protein IJZ08_01130, partial [Clostridia bacterium]|nr:hypothetical protein [Clostridia bacterium]